MVFNQSGWLSNYSPHTSETETLLKAVISVRTVNGIGLNLNRLLDLLTSRLRNLSGLLSFRWGF